MAGPAIFWKKPSVNSVPDTSRLHLLASARGQLPEEYLLEHPEYRMTQRERRQWNVKVLKLAAEMIDKHKGKSNL